MLLLEAGFTKNSHIFLMTLLWPSLGFSCELLVCECLALWKVVVMVFQENYQKMHNFSSASPIS